MEADLHQGVDTIDQAPLLDFSAAESRDGRVLPRVRDRRRAGVMAGGGGKPPRTGVPQGGVASPLWATIFLTPCDRRRSAEGFRLTRGADAVVGCCQTPAEAQRAWAIAKRGLREAWGVTRHPQTTRMVQSRQGVACRGDQVTPGTGFRRPAHRRRGRSNPRTLEAVPREPSVPRGQDHRRARTRRKAPRT